MNLKGFLILAIQVGPSINIEELSISLEEANSVVDSGIVGNPTLKTAIDDVGHQSISCSSVCLSIGLCGNVSADHDVVTRWLRLLLRHPEPQRCLERRCRVLCNSLRVSQPVESQCLACWPVVVIPARCSIFKIFKVLNRHRFESLMYKFVMVCSYHDSCIGPLPLYDLPGEQGHCSTLSSQQLLCGLISSLKQSPQAKGPSGAVAHPPVVSCEI